MPLGSHVGSLWPTLERQQYILNSHHQGNPTVRPNNKTPPSYLKNILLQGRKICCLWCECFHQDDQKEQQNSHTDTSEKTWSHDSFTPSFSTISSLLKNQYPGSLHYICLRMTLYFPACLTLLFHNVPKQTHKEISASQKGVLPFVQFEVSRPVQEIKGYTGYVIWWVTKHKNQLNMLWQREEKPHAWDSWFREGFCLKPLFLWQVN